MQRIRRWATCVVVALSALAAQPAHALVINFFDGRTNFPLRNALHMQPVVSPSDLTTLFSMMEAAATYWEGVIHDPGSRTRDRIPTPASFSGRARLRELSGTRHLRTKARFPRAGLFVDRRYSTIWATRTIVADLGATLNTGVK
jgi:hypothetical protein